MVPWLQMRLGNVASCRHTFLIFTLKICKICSRCARITHAIMLLCLIPRNRCACWYDCISSRIWCYQTLLQVVMCYLMLLAIPKDHGFHISNTIFKIWWLRIVSSVCLLYSQANLLILMRKIGLCSLHVKRYLYATHCINISGVHLWHSHRVSVLRKLLFQRCS